MVRGLRIQRVMKRWLPRWRVWTGAGCATTMHVASVSSETTVATADVGDEPTVVVEAVSPTLVRYRTEGETVVPIKRPYPTAATSHPRHTRVGSVRRLAGRQGARSPTGRDLRGVLRDRFAGLQRARHGRGRLRRQPHR